MDSENNYLQIPEERVYKDTNIYWSAVLGGPLVAAYMLASNCKTLGEKDKIPFVWLLMIGFSLFTFGALNLIPHAFIFDLLFLFFYAFLPYYIAGNYQKEKINSLIARGGKFHKLSNIMSLVLLGGTITALVFIMLF